MDYQNNTLGLSNTSATSAAAAEAHEQMDVEELDLQSGPSNESEDEPMSNLNSTVIHDEGFSIQAVGISNPSPVEPSIDEDDGVDFDDDEAEDDKERTDFQWKYMVALQKRLRKETNQAGKISDQVGALSSKWLIEFLEIHYYIVPRYCAPHICKKLGMEDKDIGLLAYYCDVKVWLPEKQFGIKAMPPCPNCLTNENVVCHGYPDTHVAREYVGLQKKMYAMGARYKCTHCLQERKEKLNSDSNAKVNIKYTFMGWDRGSLPLLYRGLGATFPAIFTHKSGVCKLVANLFAPLFDNGTCAEAVAQILLESHSLEHSRLWYLHERLNEAKLASADMSSVAMFSEFNNR